MLNERKTLQTHKYNTIDMHETIWIKTLVNRKKWKIRNKINLKQNKRDKSKFEMQSLDPLWIKLLKNWENLLII